MTSPLFSIFFIGHTVHMIYSLLIFVYTYVEKYSPVFIYATYFVYSMHSLVLNICSRYSIASPLFSIFSIALTSIN